MIKQIGANVVFGGQQLRFRHTSLTLDCDMTFSIYLPPAATNGTVPLLYWLSGLTCTDENFVQKAGAQRAAAEHGIAIVAPDTSPRGDGIPDDPDGAYDFGLGAGFYVDATEPPWAANYRMYTYVTEELPTIVAQEFPVATDRQGIFGHSMGGHGALTIAMRAPNRFASVSAFAPICAPSECPWGEKALSGYLGADRAAWRQHDACALLEDGAQPPPMLVDVGDADEFLARELHPERLAHAAEAAGADLTLNMRPGYDHSYFFIASFIDAHIAFHAAHL